ncbi:related to solute carrier family 25 member 39 [Lecanosticta acicola]|uniref:Related to solute carrier family 25 member 39 n=1 Tax=Lecanosticta acicola TaxID=111012 RepID=A0AAI8YZJ3_9PEZI|nr:related to solute carrier family 25 member 39 [Lecanosticta acicola]
MAGVDTQGQRHDRILNSAGDSVPGESEGSSLHLTTPPAAKSTPSDGDTSVGQKMLSAVSGSILTSLLITPLDVVRVRLQSQQPSPSPPARLPSFVQLPPNLGVTACCREVFWVQNQSQFCVAAPSQAAVIDEAIISDCAAEETQRRTFNSTLDGFRKISRNEGIWTLWRGLSPTLLMAIPANVIYFAGYDWLRTSPRSPVINIGDVYAPLVAGSAARILAALAVSPIEMLRTRMQAASSKEKGVLRATISGMQEMVSSQGYHSLWRGLSLTLWRDVPFSAMYWWGYEFGRRRLEELRAHNSPFNQQPLEMSTSTLLADSFIAGASSGAIAAYVTTPFDVGKTRQQTVMQSNMSAERRRALPEGRTMPRFLWHIYRHEGASGLFKGWAARCLKVAPACAIMISSYEIGKRMAVKAKVQERGVAEEPYLAQD